MNLAMALGLMLIAAEPPAGPVTMPVTVPVTMEALAGDWLLEPFAAALLTTRSPLAAATVAEPIGLMFHDQDGKRGLVVTSFHETLSFELRGLDALREGAATLVLAPAEAGAAAAPAESWRRVGVEVKRDADGLVRLRATLWGDENAEEIYRRLAVSIPTWVNTQLLAGEYRDGRGLPWRFSAAGLAQTPEAGFPYEIALDLSETDCDYFQTPDPNEPGGQRRIGFAWQGESLHLFRIRYDRPAPISCEREPWAVLARVK